MFLKDCSVFLLRQALLCSPGWPGTHIPLPRHSQCGITMASKGHLRKSFLSLLSNTIIFLPTNKEEHERGSPNAAWAALGGDSG